MTDQRGRTDGQMSHFPPFMGHREPMRTDRMTKLAREGVDNFILVIPAQEIRANVIVKAWCTDFTSPDGSDQVHAKNRANTLQSALSQNFFVVMIAKDVGIEMWPVVGESK